MNLNVSKENIASLHNVTHALSGVSQLQGLTIVSSQDMDESQLSNQHVLFVGNVKEHEVLQSHQDDLLIQQTAEGTLDVADYQFINETSEFVGWTQPSIWNEEYQMAVFAPVQKDSQSIMSADLLEFIQSNSLSSTIVVETEHGEIFSQEPAEQKDAQTIPIEEAEEDASINGWYIAGFIGIIVLSVIIIVYLLYRRKREAY